MNTIKNIPTDKVIKSAIIFQVLSKSKSKKIRECCHPDKVNDLQQKKSEKEGPMHDGPSVQCGCVASQKTGVDDFAACPSDGHLCG